MTISVRKSVAADIPAMAALDVAGYGNSPFRLAMFPPERRVQAGDGDALRVVHARATRALDSPTAHYVVAVEGEGSPEEVIVGMAIWGDDSKEKKEKKENKPSGPPPGLPSYLGYEEVMAANKEITTMLEEQQMLDAKTRNNMWSMSSSSSSFDCWHISSKETN
ncbi:hypothetical protein NLG97_g9146 [Lecanicillium saksenae]|uniref:Uncharacterized protein n=1 Tax=Lecanicillium saksenae TaxID=468837 RepID=A0ACC1QH24_9HYPO|nr:hypothetical protein NLG97_g9146 [Lecanicillium saksenae]